MDRILSDVFETCDGKFGIEWEWENGGRTKDIFDTIEEREKALDNERLLNNSDDNTWY